MRSIATLTVAAGALACLALPALAAPAPKTTPKAPPKGAPKDPKDKITDRPEGTFDSGAITMQQITQDLQYLIAKKFGLVISYVLPKGWEFVEQNQAGKG